MKNKDAISCFVHFAGTQVPGNGGTSLYRKKPLHKQRFLSRQHPPAGIIHT